MFNLNTSFTGNSKFPDDKGVNAKSFNDDKPLIEHNKMKIAILTIAGGIIGGTCAALTGGLGPAALGVGISAGVSLGAVSTKIASYTSSKILKSGDYVEWAENNLQSKEVTEKSGMILDVINTIDIDKKGLTEIIKGFDIDLKNLEGDDLDRLEIFKEDLGPYIGEMKIENEIDTQYYPNANDESEDYIKDESENEIDTQYYPNVYDESEDYIKDEIEDDLVKSVRVDPNELFKNKHAKNNRLQLLGAILLENLRSIPFINKNIASELSTIDLDKEPDFTNVEIENILFSIPQNKLKILNQVIIFFERAYIAYPNQLEKLTNTLSITLFGPFSLDLLELTRYLIKNGENISELLPK